MAPPAAATAEDAATRAWLRLSMDAGGPPGAQFSRLLARWPHSIEVAWLAWQHCWTGACNRGALARHLVDVDRRNGAAWLAMLEQAQFEGDVVGIDNALARAAAAPGFDRRHGRTYLRLQPVFAQIAPSPGCRQRLADTFNRDAGGPPSTDEFGDMLAQSFEMATTMPGFALIRECDARRNDARVQARRHDCVAVLRRLSGESNLADRMSALSLLIRWLEPADSAEYREQLRQMQWLRFTLAALDFPGPAARIWSEGEIAYFRAAAEAHGYWPPPADWLPKDEATRRLIVEGR